MNVANDNAPRRRRGRKALAWCAAIAGLVGLLALDAAVNPPPPPRSPLADYVDDPQPSPGCAAGLIELDKGGGLKDPALRAYYHRLGC